MCELLCCVGCQFNILRDLRAQGHVHGQCHALFHIRDHLDCREESVLGVHGACHIDRTHQAVLAPYHDTLVVRLAGEEAGQGPWAVWMVSLGYRGGHYVSH